MQERYGKVWLGMVLCWLSAGLTVAVAQTTVAGSTPGQFAVSESGAATYRIPIQVPPGVAGMEPKLELVYNSQGGNGLLGMGWSLGGLSAITRCPRTMAQDGVRGSVNFDSNDRYCLDGQRLMLVSGTEGTAGAEYRTERDSFSKIIANGSAGNGPASFTVQTKAGLTMEYGNTDDSRIEAQGKATVRVWAINKISDVKANYLSLAYFESPDSVVHYPTLISYGGNLNEEKAHTQSVSLEYVTPRPDTVVGHVGGSAVQTIARLTNIKTYANAALVKDYRVAYDISFVSKFSRVTSILECGTEASCRSPISFDDYGSVRGFTPINTESNLTGFYQFGGASDISGYQNVFPMDINGDGLADLLAVDMVNGKWRVMFANGHGFNAPVDQPALDGFYALGSGATKYRNFYPMDVNGDGRTDLVVADMVNGYWRIIYSNGTGLDAAVTEPNLTGFYQFGSASDISGYQNVFPMDINGDGLADLLTVDMVNGMWRVIYSATSQLADAPRRILNGTASVTFGLSSLSLAGYTKDVGPNASVYPKIDLQLPLYVVSEVQQSNGVGGALTTQYSYGGLKGEQGTGRGLLGFRWMKSKNLSNNLESYTEFNQNWPLTGTLAKSETRLAGSGNAGVLKRTVNTFAQSAGSAGTATFVYPSQSIEESWDLGGSPYPTVSSAYQYGQSPQYGDPTQITVSNSAGASKSTVNEYWPANTASGSWVLGRLKKASVTSVTP